MDLKQAREKLVELKTHLENDFSAFGTKVVEVDGVSVDSLEALDVAIKQLDIAIIFEEIDDGTDEHEQDRDDLDKR